MHSESEWTGWKLMWLRRRRWLAKSPVSWELIDTCLPLAVFGLLEWKKIYRKSQYIVSGFAWPRTFTMHVLSGGACIRYNIFSTVLLRLACPSIMNNFSMVIVLFLSLRVVCWFTPPLDYSLPQEYTLGRCKCNVKISNPISHILPAHSRMQHTV